MWDQCRSRLSRRLRQRLPSLLALRYFEAVGRNLSFTLAANELNVTQAAVSHQVRLLEQELGAKLFLRLHQKIELTAHGNELLEVAIECFSKLAEVTSGIAKGERSSSVLLNVSPLLSAHVLIPRFSEFVATEPNINVIFRHSLAPPNDREGPYDIKLFFSRTPLDNPAYELLLTDRLIPMCAPSVWRGCEAKLPQKALEATDIIHEFDYQWWEEWSDRASVDRSVVQRGIVLDDPSVLENAALLGSGIILGSKRFLAGRLQAGELVAPLGEDYGIDIYYYLVVGLAQKRRGVAKLANWIRKISKDIQSDSKFKA